MNTNAFKLTLCGICLALAAYIFICAAKTARAAREQRQQLEQLVNR